MALKEFINRHPDLSSEQIIDRIKEYQVVSFDVFDTLLKRDVEHVSDVFDYVERRYNKRFDKSISGFRNIRLQAGRLAMDEIQEPGLNDIYARVERVWADREERLDTAALMKIELELEEGLCRPNPVMADVYKYCVEHGKRVIAISDMYLDADFVARLLKKNGFSEISAVYVSSSCGVNKREGMLYQHVLDAEKLRPQELIHIGDSKRGDYLSARRKSIHAVSIARNTCRTRYWNPDGSVDVGAIYAFINNRSPYCRDHQIALGYEVYGPLLYAFTKWLTEKLDPDLTTLFFARDCFVVKQAYDILTNSANKGVYFLASRKSLILSSFDKRLSMEQVGQMICKEPVLLSLEGLLKKFGLEPQKYKDLAGKYDLSLDTLFQRDSVTEDERFLQLWAELEPEVRSIAQRNHQGFWNYFRSLSCTEDVQVVDIGWHCTMQSCLEELLPDNYSISGFYIGVKSDAVVNRSRLEGLFLDKEDDKDKAWLAAACTGMLETFFAAPHGSVGGYMQDGTVVYEPFECEGEEKDLAFLEALREGALDFIRDMAASPLHELIRPDAAWMFRGLGKMVYEPRKEEIDSFGGLPFQLSSGAGRVASPGKLSSYILAPKKLVYDFANAPWKIGFARKLSGLPLPWHRIVRYMYMRYKGY